MLARTRGELEQWARQYDLRWLKTKVIKTIPTIVTSCACAYAVIAAALAAFCRSDGPQRRICAEQESLLDELLADDLAHCKRNRER